ncbi:MAG: 30S ribosomal protein S6 [Phototrophicales bacterium]|nr:MAG: 30S ribosomal protein S6 [Phototrophicales bacterium]
MTRNYEITYIMPVNLHDEEQKATEARVIEWITSAGGTIKTSSHWGRRRLAYPIGTNREGYYVFLQAEMPPSALKDFERRMQIDANIIRHLVVRIDE